MQALLDKVAVITGDSSGLPEEVASALFLVRRKQLHQRH